MISIAQSLTQAISLSVPSFTAGFARSSATDNAFCVLIVWKGTTTLSAVTDNQHNSYFAGPSAKIGSGTGTYNVAIWYCLAGSVPSQGVIEITVTFSAAALLQELGLIELNGGAALPIVLDPSASGANTFTGGSDTTTPSFNATLSNSYEILLAVVVAHNPGTIVTANAGWTPLIVIAGQWGFFWSSLGSATGPMTAIPATLSASVDSIIAVLGLGAHQTILSGYAVSPKFPDTFAPRLADDLYDSLSQDPTFVPNQFGPQPFLIAPPTAPPQAIAAGFTVLNFDQEPNHPWDIGVGVDGHKWSAGLDWEHVLPAANWFTTDINGILTISYLGTTDSGGANLCTQYQGLSVVNGNTGTYFLGGYFEAYMLTSDWSAFWLYCANRPWVYGSKVLPGNPLTWTNEIDIVETDPGPSFINTVVTTLHTNSGGDGGVVDTINSNNNNTIGNGPVEGKWHKYGLLWTQTQITWYVDDIQVATHAPFASTWQPAQLILNAAPNGVNGSPSTVTPPITQVQWVRVWVPPGYQNPIVTPH